MRKNKPNKNRMRKKNGLKIKYKQINFKRV